MTSYYPHIIFFVYFDSCMTAKHKSVCRLIILIGFLSICMIASAQKKPEEKLGLEVDKWAAKLSRQINYFRYAW